MALTKEVIYDSVNVEGEFKFVACREATIIRDDGVEISRTFHRHILKPAHSEKHANGSFTHTDTDISAEPAETQAICNLVWTDAIKDAWKANVEA